MPVFQLLALAAAVASTGCTKSTGPDRTPSGRPSIRHPHPDRAIRECTVGLEAATAGHQASAVPTTMAACKDLYVESTCRDAWARIGPASPSEKARLLAEAIDSCRRAYCPMLPAPKPGLCEGKTNNASDPWGELQLAIFTYDLGPTRVASLAQKMSKALTSMRSSTLERLEIKPTPPCDAELAVEARSSGVWLATSSGIRRFVARCGQVLDKAALAEELCRAGQEPKLACTETVSVAAEGTVPYADAVAVMDLARLAGFPDAVFTDRESLPLAMLVGDTRTGGQAASPRCGQAPGTCPARHLDATRPVLPAQE